MKARELANSICEMLQRNRHQALLVGGCVRDLLLGREPADYDVATDATQVEVAGLFPESVAVGAQFGVILIPKNGLKVEVATFSSALGLSDGQIPERVSYWNKPLDAIELSIFSIHCLMILHDTWRV